MCDKAAKSIPSVESHLRAKIIEVPEAIYACSGIKIKGKRIKSILFSTDVAIIRNHNADAVLAVYPFTPELVIARTIIDISTVPVFAGVGGGTTSGKRSIDIAFNAELLGAYAAVVNSPTSPDDIAAMAEAVDIPIIATVGSNLDDYKLKVAAGAKIINVSAAAATPELVRLIRADLGADFPIIATGGPTEASIKQTVAAGANAITYTPPTNAEIFADMMARYRQGLKAGH
ncbi:MAG: hydrolase [Oscillospiraceae bacterium]|nr:hydrolase [Oscillospiraceae bacterium]